MSVWLNILLDNWVVLSVDTKSDHSPESFQQIRIQLDDGTFIYFDKRVKK